MLTVNKLDRCFLELMLEGEDAYTGFLRVVESANVIMATYADEALGDTQVYPEKGTVCFSAGLHGWAFTLTSFAKIYAKRFGVEVQSQQVRKRVPYCPLLRLSNEELIALLLTAKISQGSYILPCSDFSQFTLA